MDTEEELHIMAMREIAAEQITEKVRNLCIESNTILGEDMIEAYKRGVEIEASAVGKDIFRQLLENAKIAKDEGLAVCQDTGMVIVFVELGQDVHLVGGDFNEAITEGVRQGYKDGCFRASTLEPLTRQNYGDNSPAIIHVEVVPGDRLKLSILTKGFGGEMMSRVQVFHPAAGIEGVKQYIIERVEESGANPCPPVIVGVGIGGTFEKAAILSKKALLRPMGKRHSNPEVAKLEEELLKKINELGIGPQGLGGTVTALDVHIETYPTHIAAFPVAVNIQCHSNRHREAIL
jgi:fumarate hydratase subunit alpha